MQESLVPEFPVTDMLSAVRSALSGRYAIERELGRGGMATVYLAQDLKHHRPVAIKVLAPELAAALGRERFLREIETAASLSHPHILPLHDSGEADGFLYYVMPYVAGESLRERLNREKQLPIEHAVTIVGEVANALSYAHSRDVVHRDVKPENILLSDGQAIVADFGIAGAIDAAGGGKLTRTGIVLGTPAYMSPEQGAGERALDGRSDVYSLGCLLYEMLAGEPPFTGPTAQAIIAKRFTDPVPSIRRLRETVPVPMDQAIAKALARAPADRFATPHQFAEALRASAEARSDAVAAPTAATPAGEEEREAGRSAFSRHSWREAFETLSNAQAMRALAAEDVERLAESAWWIGRVDDSIAAHERAYAAYIDQGTPRRAAIVAVRLAEDFINRQAKSIGNGWLKRAERLLQDVPECLEHGVLLRLHAVLALESEGNVDKALGLARRSCDLATRFHDRDLQALAMHDIGRMLVSKGELAQGMALIDEAMATAVSGELGPRVTGRIYCNMMGTCEKLADYQRAAEWSEAARRWCEPHAGSGYPGICRVHRAELMRLRGSWNDAETEALRASQELRGFYNIAAGPGAGSGPGAATPGGGKGRRREGAHRSRRRRPTGGIAGQGAATARTGADRARGGGGRAGPEQRHGAGSDRARIRIDGAARERGSSARCRAARRRPCRRGRPQPAARLQALAGGPASVRDRHGEGAAGRGVSCHRMPGRRRARAAGGDFHVPESGSRSPHGERSFRPGALVSLSTASRPFGAEPEARRGRRTTRSSRLPPRCPQPPGYTRRPTGRSSGYRTSRCRRLPHARSRSGPESRCAQGCRP
ncbi:MAG: hypothetical protein DMD46_11135 [Gemmatimonadetes bacterium]|nr:MAG: hypothetical protein DMD46_11135 [Gemmatimonadota bacterium]